MSSMPGRESKLAVRVSVTLLVLFGPMLAVFGLVVLIPSIDAGIAKLLALFSGVWLMSSLLLSPALLFPPSDHLPGPSGGDGGGGDDPPEPPNTPSAPRGGLPLPDAEQTRERIRDHDRPDRRRRSLRPRRPAREPDRPPAPAPASD